MHCMQWMIKAIHMRMCVCLCECLDGDNNSYMRVRVFGRVWIYYHMHSVDGDIHSYVRVHVFGVFLCCENL
eukprot:jgi/Bigna1/55998/estExt_Genewise1Plus.C_790036